MQITLDELKAENAAIEAEANSAPVEDKKEPIQDEYVEVKEDIVPDTVESSTEDDDENKAELESWQLTEETETSEDDQKSGFVPNHEAAKRRKQAKALKGELNDTKDENKELLARIAALESGKQPQDETSVKPLVKPTREQFDFDDDAYDIAVEKYYDDKFDQKLNSHSVNANQKNQQEAQQQALEVAKQKSLDDHYERAAKLVSQGKVTEESFKGADKVVRMTLEKMYPGQGDSSADALISTLDNLGEGSEKVMYQLGVNPSKMQELQSKLAADPSGMLACAFLGQLQAQIQTPSKRRSQAPSPSSKADGEGGSAGKGSSMQKAYDKADGSQARITIKREAKLKGIDVSNW